MTETTKIKNTNIIESLGDENAARIIARDGDKIIGEFWFLTRDWWGAGPVGHLWKSNSSRGAYPKLLTGELTGVAIHHTAWPPAVSKSLPVLDNARNKMKRLQTVRSTPGRAGDLGPEVSYSYVLFKHPKNNGIAIIAEGRGNQRRGAHTGGRNSKYLGVCFDGNYQTEAPSDGQIMAAQFLGRALVKEWQLTVAHRDLKSTSCPGNNVYKRLSEIRPGFSNLTYELLPLTQADVDAQEKEARAAEPTAKEPPQAAGSVEAADPLLILGKEVANIRARLERLERQCKAEN